MGQQASNSSTALVLDQQPIMPLQLQLNTTETTRFQRVGPTEPVTPQPTPIDLQPNLLQTSTPTVLPDRDSLPLSTTDQSDRDSLPPSTTDHDPIPSSPIRTPPPSARPPDTSSHAMITRNRDHTRKSRQFNDFVAHLASLETEPHSFSQANTSPAWREAMATELQALAHNKTWSLVPLPTDQKVIGSKWVYKIKRKQDGTIDRFKARLVANGFHQQEGVDFLETYSPVVRPTTIRVILSIAMTSDWLIKQLDVQNAFLHGDLTETVYMTQPRGFVDSNYPNHVCLLHKSLYGLKQAPRAWFQKLSTALVELGFKPSCYDPSLFISNHNGSQLFVLVYVDDIIVTGGNSTMVENYIAQLSKRFAVKDLGKLNYFLGIEAQFSNQGLYLTQSKYITDLLSRVNMLNCKPVLTPMATGVSFSKDDGSLFDDPYLYRSVIGALQYATLTRPDITFAVNKLSQFMHNPTLNQWMAAKRILRYLCGTLNYGIFIDSNSSLDIHAYSDADWAGNIDDRRSTSGFCVYLGNNLVSWSARKHPTVSRSSTEAEYRSLALTCTEIRWVQFLLQELGIRLTTKPCLWCDNIGATFLAANPMFHARTKHIEIDYHFVREQVAAKQLEVKFLCSADQIGDVLTKPLPLPRFQFLRNKLKVLCRTLA